MAHADAPGDPPDTPVAGERRLLAAHLAGVRGHVLGQLERLDERQSRHESLPSGWSPAQLIKHLTIGDEHYWFACVLDGDSFDDLPDDDWELDDRDTLDRLLVGYRAAIERSEAVFDRIDLDAPPVHPDPQWAIWGVDFPTARHVVLHVLVEVATHAGHLDTVCELIDGRQWLVMD